jgi:chromate transport protein ChrA
MDDGRKLQRGTGFVSPGTRTVFLCLAALPGVLLVILALLTGANVFAALVIGLLIFLPSILILLLIGRSVEYYRDREWRASPDSLSNAPRRVQFFVLALIVITCITLTIQLRTNGNSWWLIVPMVAWNAFSTWLVAHFFAVKIFRFVQGLIRRGKQGL